MRSKHALFSTNHITTKKEILYSISEYISHCKKNGVKEENWSSEKISTVIRMCEELYAKIKSCNLPKLNNWWYYNYHFTNYEIVLEMCHCSEVSYDSDGYDCESTIDEIFPLITIPCGMLSVSDFAKRFGTTARTVLRWIKKGKIRSVKKYRNNWMIAELADKPSRKYHPVIYEWSSPIPQLQISFDFLDDYTRVYITQNEIEKGTYNVFLGFLESDNRKLITLNSMEREKFEFALLSLQEVNIEENFNSIMYIPLKVEDKEINKTYQKLLAHNNIIEENQCIQYGPVIVTKGGHKGRIGYYDDNDDKGCIVYFGDMLLTNSYYIIKSKALSNTIPTVKLLDRRTELRRLLHNVSGSSYHYQLLLETAYCNDMLNERYINAIYTAPSNSSKVFISHANEDTEFARMLATDLKTAGYDFFLDDWSI
jgi:hypothetical protein